MGRGTQTGIKEQGYWALGAGRWVLGAGRRTMSGEYQCKRLGERSRGTKQEG